MSSKVLRCGGQKSRLWPSDPFTRAKCEQHTSSSNMSPRVCTAQMSCATSRPRMQVSSSSPPYMGSGRPSAQSGRFSYEASHGQLPALNPAPHFDHSHQIGLVQTSQEYQTIVMVAKLMVNYENSAKLRSIGDASRFSICVCILSSPSVHFSKALYLFFSKVRLDIRQ